METPLSKIGILVIDNDESSQEAVRQVLDLEEWRVRIVPEAGQALKELATGEWSLVIVNVAVTGLSGPVYLTLKELALAPAVEEGKIRPRVLFLVPEASGQQVQPLLEQERLQYVLRPFHFHDFLEKVSDLLLETSSLDAPIRRVRHDASELERKRQEKRASRESDMQRGHRDTGMFAKREEYVMTEEEIAEYERSEQETRAQKKKKRPQDF
jgi:DNA-binding response OmpR family regulator